MNMNTVFTLYGDKNVGNLAVGAFRGMASFKFFPANSKGSPVNFPITNRIRLAIKKSIDQAIKNGPGTKITACIRSKYDVEKKVYNVESNLVIGMNDSKILYLTINSKALPQPVTVYFKSVKSIDMGVDDATDSVDEATAFVEYLYHDLPIANMLTRDGESMIPRTNGGFKPRSPSSDDSASEPDIPW